MKCFLAYVAEQYGRKKEDVATDALAYLLNRHESARAAFGNFVAECGYTLPNRYSIVSRTKGAYGVGIPDLQITDENDSCCALVENKFWAPLTDYQPVGYFKDLPPEGGLILFIAPNRRISSLWDELKKLCEKADRPIEPLQENIISRVFSGKSKSHLLCLASWEQLIPYLRNRLNNTEAHNSEAIVFIDQLERVCDVAKQEEIKPLDADILTDNRVGIQVYDYTRLLTKIANTANTSTGGYFRLNQKDRGGTGWLGYKCKIGEYLAWIVFGARVWSSYAKSPICISFDDNLERVKGILHPHKEKLDLIDDKDYGMLHIPIILTPDTAEDIVIINAVSQIQTVAHILNGIYP